MKAHVAVAAALFALAAPAFAQAPAETAEAAVAAKPAKPLSYFFGVFEGPTTVVAGAGAGSQAADRDSRVETKAAGQGFTITWSTLYLDDADSSRMKVKDSTEITFEPTETANVFKQVNSGALWSGKPHYWARIEGETLHVSALVLDADGTYDVTHYARTVEGDSMRLEFTRFTDGLLQRHVTGNLKRQPG